MEPRVATQQTAIEALRVSLSSAIALILEPIPEFRFEIGWYDDYAGLFSGTHASVTGADELAEAAFTTGRVILSGRGGGAKSVVLRRLARSRLERGDIVTLIDMKRWAHADLARWNRLRTSPERINFLVTELGLPGLSVRRLNALPPATSRLILVDGLNEVPSSTGQEILAALEQFIHYTENTGIIVADRLVRRSFVDVTRWALATVLPLTRDEIRRILLERFKTEERYDNASPGKRAILSNPYFLNAELQAASGAETMAQIIRGLFVIHAGLDDDELSLAARAAYEAYQAARARTFSIADFEKIAGNSVTEKLRSSGRLIVSNSSAAFDHHLNHDFLAAADLVRDETRWTPPAFDAITFEASSFDALALVLQQTTSPDIGDRFVRRVYDWNIYGAAYTVSEGSRFGAVEPCVSPDMETAMLAMLSIRRWDLLLATRQRAVDALRLFPAVRAKPYLEAANADELNTLVQAVAPHEPWFPQWRKFFTARPQHLALSDLDNIVEPDVIGWTFANMVRRVPLKAELREALHTRLRESVNGTVRWRIVHALGADADRTTAAVLLDRLETDDDDWVRYGAVRSLMEIAAAGNDDVRTLIIDRINEQSELLRQRPRVAAELRSAMQIVPEQAPATWLRLMIGTIETFYHSESSLDKRREWEILGYKLRELYDTEHHV